MKSDVLLSLLSDEDKKVSIDKFKRFNKVIETRKEDETREINKLNNLVLELSAKNQKRNAIRSKYKKMRHKDFIEHCLRPYEYKKNGSFVYACIKEIETNLEKETASVSISLVTPIMAYTDREYFVVGDVSQALRDEYRPYYYEFTTELDINSSKLKHFRQYANEVWFNAKISPDDNSNDGVIGALHFGGSKNKSDKVKLEFGSKSSSQVCQMLEEIYKVNCSCKKEDYETYLNKTFLTSKCDYEVNVLNVGQANCIHIRNKQNSSSAFLDIGRPLNGYYSKASKSFIVNKDLEKNRTTPVKTNLKNLYKYKPDCIFISHWHYDHIAAYCDLRDYGVSCEWLVPPITSNTITSASRIIKYQQKYGAGKTIYFLNDTSKIYDNTSGFQIWKGEKNDSGKSHDLNANSIIIRINNAIFPGDSLYRFWPDDLVNNLKDITHLVVPHHGCSINGTPDDYAKNSFVLCDFSTVTGKVAYVCVGDNHYGHPNDKHMEKLTNQNFNIEKTDDPSFNGKFNI